METIYFAPLSKAGGVGKTTLVLNIAYELSLRSKTVCIVDLDPNHSLEAFVHVDKQEDMDKSSWKIFEKDFGGEYSMISIYGEDKIKVIQGHDCLEKLPEFLMSRSRREDQLKKILKKFPLEFDVVIFDLPGGFDLITENIMTVATHLLIPIQMAVKSLSVGDLLERLDICIEDLELEHPPKILGLLPNQYKKDLKTNREIYDVLNTVIESRGLKLYEPIQQWGFFDRAAYQGKALKQLRSKDPMASIISVIVDDLLS